MDRPCETEQCLATQEAFCRGVFTFFSIMIDPLLKGHIPRHDIYSENFRHITSMDAIQYAETCDIASSTVQPTVAREILAIRLDKYRSRNVPSMSVTWHPFLPRHSMSYNPMFHSPGLLRVSPGTRDTSDFQRARAIAWLDGSVKRFSSTPYMKG